ncbi:PEP synthetase regulatory protein [Candidatus Kinetoplastibacterium blastocrithidii TCC012E]|uniref:Putative phosphoenolpyruvate synthase regulatory protein n=1 Tax=Candidatus Kinetoplastidibacterium blastocrithidiae TCC012E TaxID=1208922 RepID=M1M3T2_9PROT|nr:pyruvate, water dikinase regulatory protein [Candidatus Kinetoplastibacterium blastocrithidii]AFZ83643.1 PEP synthetase regulatory protein [Candidatus Kinetoplastibacterium blastocrithidii (ex Strigomonas culicis)]AGF49764.1 PEP synthetase regulatory protein [Candidatus Kinetoplastibacterium blastocrithidii TCC012E]
MNQEIIERTVYLVSDSTGITAETFSNAVLSQFDTIKFKQIHLPFIFSIEKAKEVVNRINQNALDTGNPPIVFSTLVNHEIMNTVRSANGIFLDIFGTFVSNIEQLIGHKSNNSIGRSHNVTNTEKYRNRIDAINFSLSHDDGQFVHQLNQADVILVGVSRCGKTPTSLYLAMQYAIKAANFPLTPDDFERNTLPSTIIPYRNKIFGLSIHPERLSEVRNERRPNSSYSTIEQCRYEVTESEKMMRRDGIPWLSTTTKSIEEIATTVLHEIGLDRRLA